VLFFLDTIIKKNDNVEVYLMVLLLSTYQAVYFHAFTDSKNKKTAPRDFGLIPERYLIVQLLPKSVNTFHTNGQWSMTYSFCFPALCFCFGHEL
jgi:hypothetical protein